jgi:Pyruvate/2-oxoacid:ferredoxin oxidoreductase delta subunit
MRYGIYNLRRIPKNENIVGCNNCGSYFYEEITDERNDNSLQFFFDTEDGEFIKSCPVCKTDHYLRNVDLLSLSEEK